MLDPSALMLDPSVGSKLIRLIGRRWLKAFRLIRLMAQSVSAYVCVCLTQSVAAYVCGSKRFSLCVWLKAFWLTYVAHSVLAYVCGSKRFCLCVCG